MLSAEDADNLSVPLGLFISKDEPKEEVLLTYAKGLLSVTDIQNNKVRQDGWEAHTQAIRWQGYVQVLSHHVSQVFININ